MPPPHARSQSQVNLESRFGAPRVRNLPKERTAKLQIGVLVFSYLSQFIPPVFTWAKNYQLRWFLKDLIAGLSTGVYGIPQTMALGVLAGLTPVYGLYSCLAPSIVYILLGPSRSMSVGPVSVISLMVGNAVISSPHPALLATTLSFFMGVAFLVLGFLRVGFLATLISRPVVVGFTAAAAVLVNTTQVKHFLGLKVKSNNNLVQWFQWVPSAIKKGPVNGWAAIMGLTCLFFLVSLRFHPRLRSVPGPVIVSVICILITWGFQLQKSAGLAIVGAIPSGLPEAALPWIPAKEMAAMVPNLIVISAISLVELVSISKTFAVKAGTIISTNSELVAVGAAAFIGSFFRTYPISASFSRTALNDSAGAKSQLSAVVATLIVIFVLLFASAAIFYLPMATLAAIVVAATLNLFDIEETIFIYKTHKRDFFVLCVAFFLTLILGPEYGVLVAICFNIFFILFDQYRLKTRELGQLPHRVTDALFDVVHPDIRAEEEEEIANIQDRDDIEESLIGIGSARSKHAASEGASQKKTRSDALFVLREHFPEAFTHPHLYIIRPADSLTYVNVDSWVMHVVSDALERLTPQWDVESSTEFRDVEKAYLVQREQELAYKSLDHGGVLPQIEEAPGKARTGSFKVGGARHASKKSRDGEYSDRKRQKSKNRRRPITGSEDRESEEEKESEVSDVSSSDGELKDDGTIDMRRNRSSHSVIMSAAAESAATHENSVEMATKSESAPGTNRSISGRPRKTSLLGAKGTAEYQELPSGDSGDASPTEILSDENSVVADSSSPYVPTIIDQTGGVREAAPDEVDPSVEKAVEDESKSKAIMAYAERTRRLEGFVIVDMIHMNTMDSIVVGRLKDLHLTLAKNYISLAIARPRSEVLHYLIPGGFVKLIGQDFVVDSVSTCVIRCNAVLRAAKRFQALNILKKRYDPELHSSSEEEEDDDYLAKSTRTERDEKNQQKRRERAGSTLASSEDEDVSHQRITGEENV